MRRDGIKNPVAPASAIRANESSEDLQNSMNCSAREAVSSRPTVSTTPPQCGRYIDFAEVNRAALSVFPAVLRRLLPDGRKVGTEYVALNPRRLDRRLGSFKVNLNNGKWADFATSDKGGDPISLVSYLTNVPQAQAARLIAQMVGGQIGSSR
jgi:hypothetical protein